ncbi:MAG TPA: PKD domain-containing protein, partial [Candidatus Dormibacteraeota bacterium]|nr:PKD domain-containing protein [Candidatus Dormibacteraeota bacterium]
MNFKHKIAALLMATDVSAMAEVHYVDMNSTNATPPYTNWATAATNIQSAVDASMAGDEIVVTNGIYSGGLWVGKALILRSVNGWQLTTINGNQTARCAYLTNGASLTGFTLTNGFSQYHGGAVYGGTLNDCALRGNSAENGGGAAACLLNSCSLSSNSASISGGGAAYSTLNNCTLAGNSASSQGGGASYSTLKNCALTENSASYFGGGASSCPLTNCTLTGNSAQYAGGGASGSTLNNCIVYFNTANDGANYDSSSTLNYCCATPQPVSGIGNISLDPQMAGASHLSAASPCRGAGNAAYATGTDIDGESWANPPSIGCDDYHAGVVSGPLTVLIVASLTTVTPASAVQMKALIDGRTTASFWDFGDGITVSNRTYIAHTWTTLGDYPVVLRAYNDSQPGGISATVTVHVVDGVHYVAADSANPTAPYASWQTAATNIQDAMDAALEPGAVVLVTNGTYSSGRGVIFGTTNRVAAQRPVALRSVNGPQFTTIDGGHSIRCVYLTNGSSLCGFTLTNGFAQYYGGGVYCESGTVVISNCVLSGNSVANSGYGGGAFNATLNDCTVTNNSAGSGGGAYYCTLKNCKLAGNWASSGGGAAYGGSLTNCTLIGNWSLYAGGGTSSGTLNNCTLSGNWAYYGGGASASTLNNCTLSSNLVLYSTSYGGGNGGAAESCTLSNCTLNGNAAYLYGGGAYNCTLTNCILNGNVVYYDGGGGAASSTLNNCTLTGNSALGSYYGEGGGAYLGKLNGCSLTANSALYGGGAYEATLNNCTLTGNSARNQGGGAAYSTVNNCIAYYNSAPAGSNYADGRLDHCCTIPLPTDGFSSNNITSEPQLTDSSHLSPTSPCRGAGNAAYAFGVDIDGEPWANPPSIGCDEYHPGAVTGALSVTIVAGDTNVTAGFSLTFTATISGHAASNEWDFADGTLVANRPVASHTWSAPGDYVMVFRAYNQSNPAGVSATLAIHVVQAEHYVALSSGNPLPPYLSWATAAQSIQDAIDVSLPGAVIWVSNGVYQSGGHIATGGTSNRLTVTRPMTVRALNGPAETAILGSTNTTGPVRCAWLADGAVLDGFTLSGGATYDYGGGVWCASTNVLVANCILSGNKASSTGGGAYYGTLSNCALAGNLAENAYGGGAAYSVLLNSALTNNHAYYGGGGTYFGALNNCTLISNSISYPSGDGGGAYYATLNNC